MDKKHISDFQKTIWDFYLTASATPARMTRVSMSGGPKALQADKTNKRNSPWRNTKDSYKILVSEIMLQQTQADRVVNYYNKWPFTLSQLCIAIRGQI